MFNKIKKSVIIIAMLLSLSACMEWVENNVIACGFFYEATSGFNINWSLLPPLNNELIAATVSLKPEIIRYPGGAVSKSWDWAEGRSSKGGETHTLEDLLTLKQATEADVIFVLNIMNRSLDDQVALLKTAREMGIPIRYIEMGNEHYLQSDGHQDNVDVFPTGREYALRVNSWVPRLREEFPDAKIGLTLLGRTSEGVSDDMDDARNRLKFWNQLVVATAEDYDAFIYHIYVRPGNDIELTDASMEQIIARRMDDFQQARLYENGKETWITEYGVHADTVEKTVRLTRLLADWLEYSADISLAQVLYTPSTQTFFSMLTPPEGRRLTLLGEMFLKRVEPLSPEESE